MPQVWFTSDTHFGHANIIKYCHRPFLCDADRAALAAEGAWHDGDWKGPRASRHRISPESVRMMDDALVDNINRVVAPGDVLWHLGDWCFGVYDRYHDAAARYRERIDCRTVNLVWGNHDRRGVGPLFATTNDVVTFTHRGQYVVLCHYAMAVWDKGHRGAWHLYGHSHAGAEATLDRLMPDRRALDVGVDNAARVLGEYRPWSFDEVAAYMAGRNGFAVDHHVPKGEERPTEEELLGRG